MLELPTIKTDFLFKNSQDFNQTTHARPQYPIVFIDNITLYFNSISSVKYVFKWSRHSHVMPFSAVWPKRFNVPNQKIEYAYSMPTQFFFVLFKFQNGNLWWLWQRFWKVLFVVFHMLYCVPIFLNNSKAKLVVTVS